MVVIEVAGEKYSVDKKLMHNWNKIKDGKLAQLDEDRVYIVDGREGCQPKGSKVMMCGKNKWKNIEDVKIKDYVFSPQHNGDYICSKVLRTNTFFSKKTFDVFEVSGRKRKLYSCSANHEIPVRGDGFFGEYTAEKLFKIGDEFITPMFLHREKRVILKEAPGKKVYGFTLDSKSQWYVTDNFMITKNSGKSVWALQQAGAIDPTLFEDALKTGKIPRICFTGEETLHAIRNTKSTKSHTKVIIFDEAFRGLASTSVLSKINRQIVQVLMEMRQNNLVLFIILPSFTMLDKYAAMNRGNALFHIHKPKQKRNKKTYHRKFYVYNYEKKGILCQMDKKKAWTYPIRSHIHGNFYNKYPGGKEFEKIYRREKHKAFREVGRKLQGETEESKQTLQRNMLLYYLKENYKAKWTEIAVFLKHEETKLDKATMSRVYKQTKKWLRAKKMDK